MGHQRRSKVRVDAGAGFGICKIPRDGSFFFIDSKSKSRWFVMYFFIFLCQMDERDIEEPQKKRQAKRSVRNIRNGRRF